MKWRCDNCGHEQPRHPATKPEEMPLCDQFIHFRKVESLAKNGFRDRTGKWIAAGTCGGKFQPVD